MEITFSIISDIPQSEIQLHNLVTSEVPQKMSKKTKYVIGIDIGTTSVRSLVYDERGEVVGEAHSSLDPVIPQPGCYEIDPDQLWEKVTNSEI